MDAKKFPVREQIMLTGNFKLELFRDTEMSNTRFRLCQRSDRYKDGFEYPKNLTEGEWIVRADFAHIFEVIPYLNKFNWNEM